jgi:hypothetical protein
MVEGLGLHRRGCVDERGGDGGRIPASFTHVMAEDAGFRAAVDMLDRLDPHRVFSTKFLDRLMPRSADLNGDGVVNGVDLGQLPGMWQGGEGAG